MKKVLLTICVALMMVGLASAQEFVWDPFDQLLDVTYQDSVNYLGVNDTSTTVVTLEETIVHEGSAALRFDWRAQRAEGWGGYTKAEIWNPDPEGVWDFSGYENISMWYYNDEPSSDPGHVQFRLSLSDVSDCPINTYDAGQAEFWYSFEYILDDEPGWNQMVIPLEDVGPAATDGMNGFWSNNWNGIDGNLHLDLNMIKCIHFEFSIDAPQDFSIHEGSIIFDALGFMDLRNIPFVMFNGAIVPPDISLWTWAGSIAVEEGAGYTEGTNALAWTVNGPWQGAVWEKSSPHNMTAAFAVGDSVKFKMKAPAGTGPLRFWFEDDPDDGLTAKFGSSFQPIDDGQWHEYALPLNDMVYWDGTTDFDVATVYNGILMTEDGSFTGQPIYIDDFWTGNPEIDVVAPPPPSSLVVVPDTYSNLVTWLDATGETGEVYNIYYSLNPITDVEAPGVEVIEMGLKIPEATQNRPHRLLYPLVDHQVTYYYAMTCMDPAGNYSDIVATTSAVSNTARGVATLSLDANLPGNFTADGNFSEWSSIMPTRLFPSEGAHIATNTQVDDDTDLSFLGWLAGDAEYLYFAFDVTDDVIDTTATNTWEKDCVDLFIGLYDFHGAPHVGYGTGDEPDYHFRFLPSRAMMDNAGGATVIAAEYYWGEQFPIGYAIEGKIAWADIAATVSGASVFSPVNGMRIPLDFSINDADLGTGVREGIMTLFNDDTGHLSPSNWLYSWVGDQPYTGIEDDHEVVTANRFALQQNYPNPFNPSTTIAYTLAANQNVRLKVYNTVGQLVRTLVDEQQPVGPHQVVWDGRNDNGLTVGSGVYFYRIETDEFTHAKKMMMLK